MPTHRASVDWAPEAAPEEPDRLHHAAHETCFIANSIRTEITVEARPGMSSRP